MTTYLSNRANQVKGGRIKCLATNGALMATSELTAYWIVPPSPHGPLGFGVTAWSFDDALQIIRALDYGRYLPDDPSTLNVTEDITVASLDQPHVVPNMGPIAVRGMWYPFAAVGVPDWAMERLRNSLGP